MNEIGQWCRAHAADVEEREVMACSEVYATHALARMRAFVVRSSCHVEPDRARATVAMPYSDS